MYNNLKGNRIALHWLRTGQPRVGTNTCFILQMSTSGSAETSLLFCYNTRHHIPDDKNFMRQAIFPLLFRPALWSTQYLIVWVSGVLSRGTRWHIYRINLFVLHWTMVTASHMASNGRRVSVENQENSQLRKPTLSQNSNPKRLEDKSQALHFSLQELKQSMLA